MKVFNKKNHNISSLTGPKVETGKITEILPFIVEFVD